MTLRDPEAYPPQEPFSEIGGQYHQRVQELGAGIDGQSFAYDNDPYQEVAVFTAETPNGVVLAFLHGGGWTNGYKEWMSFMAPPLNAGGHHFCQHRLSFGAAGHLAGRRSGCGVGTSLDPR